MTKTSKLQAKIQEKETQLLELQDKRRQLKEQIDGLETERRGLAVAAVVKKSADAQKAIERIAEKIAKAQQEDTLNAEAFGEVSSELDAAKGELRREQRHAQFESVLAPIKDRLERKLEDRILKIATDLQEVASEISASDEEIADALRRLGPKFYAAAQEVGYYLPLRRAGALTMLLRDTLRIPITSSGLGANQIPAMAVRLLGELMQKVEAADTDDPGEPADWLREEQEAALREAVRRAKIASEG